MAERVDQKILTSQLSTERVSGRENSAAGLSWERFSQWVCCVCVVTFDLELGQAMEVSKQLQSLVWLFRVTRGSSVVFETH